MTLWFLLFVAGLSFCGPFVQSTLNSSGTAQLRHSFLTDALLLCLTFPSFSVPCKRLKKT